MAAQGSGAAALNGSKGFELLIAERGQIRRRGERTGLHAHFRDHLLRRIHSQTGHFRESDHRVLMKNGSHFQAVFRRLLPRLGYQSAIWAVAHRLCRVVWKILHEGVRFIEQGREPDPKAKKQRARMLVRALRKLGYDVAITPISPATTEMGMQMECR